jgi:hypothetical protein
MVVEIIQHQMNFGGSASVPENLGASSTEQRDCNIVGAFIGKPITMVNALELVY